jgi:hypothetical protein
MKPNIMELVNFLLFNILFFISITGCLTLFLAPNTDLAEAFIMLSAKIIYAVSALFMWDIILRRCKGFFA